MVLNRLYMVENVTIGNSLYIIEGLCIGRLVIGLSVSNIRDHILYIETPLSYINQGKLRECFCNPELGGCGRSKLIPERVLATGRVKSCGCLREQIRLNAIDSKVKRAGFTREKSQLTASIKEEQIKLRAAQMRKDDRAEEEIGQTLRRLLNYRISLGRKFAKCKV